MRGKMSYRTTFDVSGKVFGVSGRALDKQTTVAAVTVNWIIVIIYYINFQKLQRVQNSLATIVTKVPS